MFQKSKTTLNVWKLLGTEHWTNTTLVGLTVCICVYFGYYSKTTHGVLNYHFIVKNIDNTGLFPESQQWFHVKQFKLQNDLFVCFVILAILFDKTIDIVCILRDPAPIFSDFFSKSLQLWYNKNCLIFLIIILKFYALSPLRLEKNL